MPQPRSCARAGAAGNAAETAMRARKPLRMAIFRAGTAECGREKSSMPREDRARLIEDIVKTYGTRPNPRWPGGSPSKTGAFPRAEALAARGKTPCNSLKIAYVHDLFQIVLIVRPIGGAAARCVRARRTESHSGQTNFRAVLAKRTSHQRSMVRPVGGRPRLCRAVRPGRGKGHDLHFGVRPARRVSLVEEGSTLTVVDRSGS